MINIKEFQLVGIHKYLIHYKGLEIKLNMIFLMQNYPKQRKLFTLVHDKFYNYKYGKLEYKTTRFDHKKIETDNFRNNNA